MYLNRLVNSVTIIPEINELSDNVNRLYNIGGTLYFNGSEIGTGTATGDASNDWVNSNDYSTYTTLTGSIDTVQSNLTFEVSNLTANDYNTYTTLNGSINTVQGNLTTSISTLTANDGATLLTARSNDYNTYTTLKSFIDTIQTNVGSNISSSSITPPLDNTGYIGNISLSWGEGWFNNLHVSNQATVTGQLTVEGNLVVTGNVVTVNATTLEIEDNMIYLNSNSTVANPDLGIAGNYNDGTYAHTGIFRDATDGYWKVFEGYTPEPDDSPYINTSHETFSLAVFQASEFRGDLVAAVATVNSVNVLANDYNSYTTLNGRINTVQNNLATLANNVWVNANDYTTYTTLNGSINTVQGNLTTSISTLTANDGATLLSARANDYNTYTSLVGSINTVQGNLTSSTSTLAANDGVTLLTARSNDYGTYTTLTANDYNSYTTLNGRINLVQANLDATSSGVWTDATDRAYYIGNVVVNSNTAYAWTFYVNGNAKVSSDFEVGGTLTESSSVLLKENIVPLGSQLNKLLQLRPVEYDKIETKSHEYGLIAEEVAEIIPQVVSEGSTSIQYTRLIPTLIKAIQELTDRLKILESK